jgi:hypothetical protein
MKFAVFALIGGASAVSLRQRGPYDNRINYGATSQTAITTKAAVGSVTNECNANPELTG